MKKFLSLLLFFLLIDLNVLKTIENKALDVGEEIGFVNFLVENYLNSEEEMNSCQKQFQQMSNYFLNSKYSSNFVKYSGKKLNDLGNFQKCSDSADSHYILIYIEFRYFSFYTLGLCLPDQCSSTDLDFMKPYLVEYGKDYLNRNFDVDAISFTDSEKTNQENKENNQLGFYLGMALFAAIIILVIIGTIIDVLPKYLSPYDSPPSRIVLKLEELKRKLSQKVILGFSFPKNFAILFGTDNKFEKELNILNGIRLLTIIWLTFGYGFLMETYSSLYNLDSMVDEVTHSFALNGILLNSFRAYDTFFFLSGFLSTYSLTQVLMPPKNRKLSVVLHSIFHRFLRLFPIYLWCIIFGAFVFPYMFNTPRAFLEADKISSPCKDHWYRNIIFIDNFFSDMEDTCIPWGWFINVDMQFFIIAPILALIYCYKKAVALIVLICLVCASVIVQMVLIPVYDVVPTFGKREDLENIWMNKPYTRINTFCLGVLLGWMYLSYSKRDLRGNVYPNQDTDYSLWVVNKICDKIKQWKVLRYSLYVIGFWMTFAGVFALYPFNKYPDAVTKVQALMYIMIIPPTFVIGLILMFLPALIGERTIVSDFLGHNCLGHLSKLSYGIYMIMPFLYLIINSGAYSSHSYSLVNLLLKSGGIFFVSALLSLMFTLVLESPLLEMEKLYVYAGNKKKYKPKKRKYLRLSAHSTSNPRSPIEESKSPTIPQELELESTHFDSPEQLSTSQKNHQLH